MDIFCHPLGPDTSLGVLIGRKLEIFNKMLKRIEGAGIRNYVGSLHGHLEEEKVRNLRNEKWGVRRKRRERIINRARF